MNPISLLQDYLGRGFWWVRGPSLWVLGASTFLGAQEARIPAKGYALLTKGAPIQPFTFGRHPVGNHDILIETLYAGICHSHSHIHHAHGDWRAETYPMVPGHEIAGIPETQEMLDYSVSRRIYPRVEIIPIQNLDEAYRKVVAGEVKFRYVIDMKSLQ